MFGTEGVVASISAEDIRICDGECVVEGKLDRRGESAVVHMQYGTLYEGGRPAIRADDRLPDAGVTTKEVVLFLHHVKETGLGLSREEGGSRKTIDCCSSKRVLIVAMPRRPDHLMEYLKRST